MTKQIEDYIAPGNTVIAEAREVKTEVGGIFLPSDSIDKSFFEILSVGKTFESDDVKVGDLILVNGKGGDRIDIGTGTYWVYPTKMIAAKIVDDEVIPLSKFITLEFEEIEDRKDMGGIIVNAENNENPVRYLNVVRSGDKCVDLSPNDTVVIESDKCIPVDTKKGKIFLTSELVVLGKIEE